jgi:oligosaccharide repeat unit polymerase
MGLVSFIRSTSDPFEMGELLRDEVAENGLDRLSLVSSGELQVGSNFMRLIEGIKDGETTYTWGTSIATEILVFVPKALIPNRPLSLSEKYVEVFHPGELETGAGYGLFILQEGYWAFGLFGVFLFMFCYGWVLERIYLLFMNYVKYDVAVMCYSMVYMTLALYAVRTGTILNFKAALIDCLPFILVLLLPSLRMRVEEIKTK